jgi:signal transduction histidine kinase/HAMP domain-containing protein
MQRIRAVPSTGMRGGLGRTLLSAFLLLAIGPLSLVGYVAFNQVRSEKLRDTADRLTVAAQLEEARLRDWLAARQASLVSAANDLDWLCEAGAREPADWKNLDARLARVSDRDALFSTVYAARPSENAKWLAARAGPAGGAPASAMPPQADAIRWTSADGREALFELAVPVRGANGAECANAIFVVGLAVLRPAELSGAPGLGQAGGLVYTPLGGNSIEYNGVVPNAVYLVNREQQTLRLRGAVAAAPPAILARSAGEQANAAERAAPNVSTYKGAGGASVVGVYRRLDDLNSALISEQDLAAALARSDELAAGLIGAVLGVALLTTLIAAVVTRRITRPIVLLTEAALKMSDGDLSAHVAPTRRDEIGILGGVFNTMAAELSSLYTGLELKVVERTSELQKAKEQIQYHAWQLSISAEVGRITTSILDLNLLLERASGLIRDAFQLERVGVYLLHQSGENVFLFNNVGRAVPAHEQRLRLSGDHPVSAAIRLRAPHKFTQPCHDGSQEAVCELVLPMAIGAKTIGALDLITRDAAGFNESDQSVLQTLADQMSVAIENARAYSLEHEAADEMREIDRLRGQFLMRMSHQLATYLNTILGFSKLMLKGVDGPLNDMQTKDMTAIRRSSQQLKQLLDDILELANLEVGEVELERAPVHVPELIEGLRNSLQSLLVNPQLRLEMQVEPDCPDITADANRLRQVLINLVMTASEMSREGAIRLCAARKADQVTFRVESPALGTTALGTTALGTTALSTAASAPDLVAGAGATPHAISLALSRRLIDLHGGQLRMDQNRGQTIVSFSLPATALVTTAAGTPAAQAAAS